VLNFVVVQTTYLSCKKHKLMLGPSLKTSAVRGDGVCPCPVRTRKVLQKQTSALLEAKKNFGFFEIYGVSTQTRGLSSADKERGGQFFAILCGCLLSMAPCA